MNRMLVVWVAIGTLISAACGSTSDADDASRLAEGWEADSAELIQERVLAEFDVAGEHHTFLRWGSTDDAMLAHRIQGAADASSPLVSLLDGQGAPLTTLEVFLALAPRGLEPPPELRERHAQEALALGRDERVLELTIDKQQRPSSTGVLNPPAGKTACDTSLFFPPLPSVFWKSQVVTSGNRNSFLCTSGSNASTPGTQLGVPGLNSCSFSSTDPKMVGVCTANSSVRASAGFGLANSWGFTDAVALGSNQYVIWRTALDGSSHRLAAFGTSLSNLQYGLRAGVRDLGP